jgi:hypothetical protein
MTLDDIKAHCEEVGDCWVWQGSVLGTGYPQAKIDGKCVLIRRLALELIGRPPNPRQPVMARCDDKRCCNPEHLVPTNARVISKRAAAKGLYSTLQRRAAIARAKRATAKLTPELVAQIRENKESLRAAVKRFGVSQQRIHLIRSGKAWIDYSNPFIGLGAR